jgi:integrase/recombinase XerD
MRFEEFLNERKYLLNVSHKTLVYYGCAFRAWEKHYGDGKPATWIKNMLESGIKPVSVNTYICAMNTYWKWEGAGTKLKYIKEEEKILTTLSPQQVHWMIHGKPIGRNQTRAHLVALTILDCGLRISETLSLRKEDIDLENLSVHVMGKGGKHRLVPISQELRSRLFRYMRENEMKYLFQTRSSRKVSIRNMERDFKTLFKRVGIEGVRASPHTLRHSFAICYLRNGGDLFTLSRILGHSSISTTQIYLRSIGIDQIKESHQRFSPLCQHSR